MPAMPDVPALRLVPRQTHRCLDGHPWVFRSELEPAALAGLADGAEVAIVDPRDRLVGRGWYGARSQIAVRLLTRHDRPCDDGLVRERLAAALAHRAAACAGRAACRLVSSEGDLLPGFIVDRYGDRLVVQATTSAADARLPAFTALLTELCRPAQIVERDDFPARDLEGLPRRAGILAGPADARVRVRLGRIELDVDLLDPHKTGAYLDQQASHEAVAAAVRPGERIADVFAHRGGFALHALLAGAASAVAVDEAAAGLADADAAAGRLGLDGRLRCDRADAFAWLRRQEPGAFDLIVLDPPTFTRNRAGVAGALRGYRDLHLHALRLLRPGGRLASFSCSSHVDEAAFLATAADAAGEARRTLRFDAAYGQPADHPWLPAAPETRYLKGFLVTVLE